MAARRLGVHLRRGRGSSQGAHVQAMHRFIARIHRFRGRTSHINATNLVLVDLHIRSLALKFNFN